jgi:hypothetical protein
MHKARRRRVVGPGMAEEAQMSGWPHWALLGRPGRHTVTREGPQEGRPGREGVTGAGPPRRRASRRGEQLMVPAAGLTSYYGKPVLNRPVWESPDIPGYLFLSGLAGAASLLGAGGQLTGRPALARAAKTSAFGAGCLSLAALIHDLGRPARFLHMLRVVKVTSPMNVGSWLLGGYVPAAGVAAVSALTGRMPRLGTAATAGSALLGPAVAAYTAALISDTAVPAWHDAYPEMPFVFTGSGAMAAGGLGMLAAPPHENAPARYLALLGLALEASAFERMKHRIGMVAEPYHSGRGGAYIKAGQVLSLAGLAGTLLGRRSRAISGLSGAAFMAASAATRWEIFHAGLASADDPRYTVIPQRHRTGARQAEAMPLPDNRGPGWVASSTGADGRETHKVATSHDSRGAGRPRLIVALGGLAPEGAKPREFDLEPGVTIIGSGPDTDVRLEGLESRHAEIRHDEQDEYVFINRGTGSPGRVDGQPASQKPLRTGDRIEIGDWTLSYVREEFADHGKLDFT